MNLPPQTSLRNPIGFIDQNLFLPVNTFVALGRKILLSDEVDALITHGIGWAGMHTADTPDEVRVLVDTQKQQIQGLSSLEREIGLPVLIGTYYDMWESQVVYDLNKQRIRTYAPPSHIVKILSLMYKYFKKRTDNSLK